MVEKIMVMIMGILGTAVWITVLVSYIVAAFVLSPFLLLQLLGNEEYGSM